MTPMTASMKMNFGSPPLVSAPLENSPRPLPVSESISHMPVVELTGHAMISPMKAKTSRSRNVCPLGFPC